MRVRCRDAPLLNCREGASKRRPRAALLYRHFSTLVTFQGYYSARLRIKKKPLFFFCSFTLPYKHNLPISFKFAKRCNTSGISFPPHSSFLMQVASRSICHWRCLQCARLVTYCEIRCQAVNQRCCRRRKLQLLIRIGEDRRGSSGCESWEFITSTLSNYFKK